MTDGIRLAFHGWMRSGLYGVVPSPALTADGRLTGQVQLTLRNDEPPNESASTTVSFDLLGPGDVSGLKPGAITRMVPVPGTLDAEETKCAFIELAAPDLAWRYTPALATGARLRPWLVVVTAVAGTGEATLEAGGAVTLTGAALATHDLTTSARWAHLQEDADHPGQAQVARILSPRDLAPDTAYLAVVVPAFTATGQAAWTAATASVTLPAYTWWQFATGDAGDFPSLASQLVPGQAPAGLGVAPLTYGPLPLAPALGVRGALAPVGSADAPVPAPIASDVTVLTQPVIDPLRPVVGLPNYGDVWLDDPTTSTWGAAFHTDPRPRAAAGLGLRAGIEQQDLLADAAAAQAGALAAAAQRVRHLTAGLAASQRLWRRRLPTDPTRRLTVLGPTLRRMPTAAGAVRDLVAGPGLALAPALFSTAARRLLRTGPARTSAVAVGATDPAALVPAANTPPPPPPRAPAGLPHADRLAATGAPTLDAQMIAGVKTGRVPAATVDTLYSAFDRKGYNAHTLSVLDETVTRSLAEAKQSGAVHVMALMDVLDPTAPKRPDDSGLLGSLQRLDTEPDGPSLLALAALLRTSAPHRPVAVADLDALTSVVDAAVDPTGAAPFLVGRVLSTIEGIDDQPLAPPELSPDLDLPAWTFLRDEAPDWLLPGAQGLDDNHVVAVQTNQAFVDAFLLGLNTQTVGELRFRNIPIVSRSTPLRQFWSRVDPAVDGYVDDIVGVANWTTGSALGDGAHQPPTVAGTDVVIVVRSPLFRRYPRTLVYLSPLTDTDLTTRVLPVFQGVIAPDLTFFGFPVPPTSVTSSWVVLEEPPHGAQFFNSPAPTFDPARTAAFAGATDGGASAAAAYADPYRVMIRGDVLVPAVTP